MLQIKDICKKYKTGDFIQTALDHVNLSFRENEFVAILGPSGSGKTTLLNIVGGLDRYDDGDLIINGVSTKKYKDKDWDSYRNHTIGFVFQSYNLIPHQTVLSNVELALTISHASSATKKQRAIEALERVGLKDHINKKPNQLSGGQMQRVAIARALVNNPDIILADEPTGALDTKTSVQVMELLKEVASEKLVIMVTHNPELAEEYATRIVNLKDGQIISDSDPVTPQELEIIEKKTEKTKLGFFTALSLSLNNLMTKKGRTFLTAFAGAIGIIGIALILSLSTGVNDYIKQTESNMLGAYPIELQKQTISMDSMMEATVNIEEHDGSERKIFSRNIIGDTVQTTSNMLKENDLRKFNDYLISNQNNIKDSLNAVEYHYSITPQAYRKDKKEGVIKVSPASLMGNQTNPMSSLMPSTMSMSGGLTSSWSQLVKNKDLREKQYELLEGKWPEKYNEVALIINSNYEISDYTLYTLGLMDISKMEDIIDKAKNNEKFDKTIAQIDYKKAIGLKYNVFAPAQLYKKSDDIYVNKDEDYDYIETILDEATPVKITCVLKAGENAGIQSGIGYNVELATHLMDVTKDCDVIIAQMESKNKSVLNGEKFEEETEEELPTAVHLPKQTVQKLTGTNERINRLQELMNPDGTMKIRFFNGETEIPLQNIMTTTPERLKEDGTSYHFIGWVDQNTKYYQDTQTIMQNMSTFNTDMTFYALFADEPIGSKPDISQLTEEEKQIIAMSYLASPAGQAMLQEYMKEFQSNIDMDAYIQQYMTEHQDEMQSLIMSSLTEEDMQKMMMGYMNSDAGKAYMESYMKAYSEEYMKQMQSNINIEAYMQQYMSEHQDEIMKQMQDSIKNSLSGDQIDALLAQYSNNVPKTYEETMSRLGYCTIDEPSSIALYPVDFDNKTVVQDFIKAYNDQIEDEADYVTYTDIIGILTSSITDIVDTISYILVAFVAISLIVSSIMIAIITYISVLERTKEIGVLRALGSSKNDISKIFNAETFIEGFISGIIGIGVTLLLSIPINSIVLDLTDVPNICKLPMEAGIILIAISVILTLLAGFFPSRIAAKKDPVKALRTE